MQNPKTQFTGLTNIEVENLQKQYGKNELVPQKNQNFFFKIIKILSEPMFLLLIIAAVVYFILGEPRDGAIMLIFVVVIISIDVVQEWKTDKTLKALKELATPKITVLRNGEKIEIESVNLVPGDIMFMMEGLRVPADGKIVKCNDFCVDESSLTGESVSVWKSEKENKCDDYWKTNYCYAGTLVKNGTATVIVESIGQNTEYGKIGKSVALAKETKTPLQKQTRALVKTCSIIALVLFVLVCIITFFNLHELGIKERFIQSILSGITLAMAMIPEEFPVVFTVFMSMGAWRLAKKHSLIRKLASVETLGQVTVLCVDKTGTITTNNMTVANVIPFQAKKEELETVMAYACEDDAYDAMENAILNYLQQERKTKSKHERLVYEYSFTNETKMMGHAWETQDGVLVACKGAPEEMMKLCNLNLNQAKNANKQVHSLFEKGYRVLAVGAMKLQKKEEVPKTLQECKLTLLGFVALWDPPKENIEKDILTCKRAGIRVVMITGDNGTTAKSIAKKIGMENTERVLTGEQIHQLSINELKELVKTTAIFSRVLPEHKMKIVQALHENGEIVAMTGDGVNDASALKYADIGISMGKRGCEVSREASDLILLDDNFSTIVETVKDGRRIYDNIKKAIGYIFSIHIPIALAALLAPLLGIASGSLLLLPLHVMLLELLIDPTCSIVLEREPAEADIMRRKPRKQHEKLLTKTLLFKSLMQGFIIFVASFLTYYFVMQKANVSVARTMGLGIIILSNLFLVVVNSSSNQFAYKSLKKLAKDKVMWFSAIFTLGMLFIIIYTPLNNLLKLSALSLVQIFSVIVIAIISVFWYEIVKLIKWIIINKKLKKEQK